MVGILIFSFVGAAIEFIKEHAFGAAFVSIVIVTIFVFILVVRYKIKKDSGLYTIGLSDKGLADMGYTNVYEFGGIIDWTGGIVTGD